MDVGLLGRFYLVKLTGFEIEKLRRNAGNVQRQSVEAVGDSCAKNPEVIPKLTDLQGRLNEFARFERSR